MQIVACSSSRSSLTALLSSRFESGRPGDGNREDRRPVCPSSASVSAHAIPEVESEPRAHDPQEEPLLYAKPPDASLETADLANELVATLKP